MLDDVFFAVDDDVDDQVSRLDARNCGSLKEILCILGFRYSSSESTEAGPIYKDQYVVISEGKVDSLFDGSQR